MTDILLKNKTEKLIDNLKSVCSNYGLGNDGNEFKIITQVFLYKFINDKFRHEAKKHEKQLKHATNFQETFESLNVEEYGFLIRRIGNNSPKLKPEQTIDYLFGKMSQYI